MLNVPNFLTLMRTIAVPIFLILITNQQYAWALVLFVLAGVTDAFDGVIARLTHTESSLGATLDPLADKLLLVSAFLLLTWLQAIPVWLCIIVFMRYVILVGGYLAIYFFSAPIEVRPSTLGKVNTGLQMIVISYALVSLARPTIPMEMLNIVFAIITGVTTSLTGIHYIYTGLLFYQQHE